MKRRLLVADFNACGVASQEPYRFLASAGFEVRLLIPLAWRESHGLAMAEPGPSTPGLQIRPVPVVFNGRYHRVLFKGLGQAMEEFQPDEIWLHAEPENFLAYQGLWARDRHCPGARLNLVSWRNIDYPRGQLPMRAGWLHQWIQDRLRKDGTRLFCYNSDAARIMAGLGFETQPVRMGVNLKSFYPGNKAEARQRLGLPVKAAIVGFAGRFIEEKGVSDLIAAAARIPHLRLLLIGDGPARAAWLGQAQEAGVLVDMRTLKHEQMATAFRAMDVACLPSRSSPAWKEQFGRVLVEAMACGTPVLGSDSGAIPAVIAGAGLTYPEGDVRALGLALARLLKKPPRAAALKRARTFAWKSVAEDLAKHFKGPVSRRLNTVPVQGLGVFGGSRDDFFAAFSRKPGLVFYLNAHVANLAAADPEFKRLLGRADFVLPDGAGILLSARLNGHPLPERMALGDLLASLSRLGKRIFLWGGEPGVAEIAAKNLPGNTVGCADGFQDEAGMARVIHRVRALRADLIFLGMGSPKQERLALRLREELKGVSVVVCGNAFAFVAGLQQRAPAWMQAMHMEWAWRLLLEPGRLGKRYLLGNLRFIARGLWERMGGRP
jgi:exopolysaccharide biosynthesis WecB/TagA/CpsF family protein